MATLYFNGAVDSDWDEIGNWWTSGAFTTQASSLPTSSDSVVLSATCDTNSGSAPTVVNLTFNDSYSEYYIGIAITVTGNATFNERSFNNGTLTGNATFNDSSSNQDSSTVTGDATFNDSSYNYGTVTGDATFNDSSANNGGSTVTGDATFNDSSYNYYGTVTENATFNHSSYNYYGTVTENATFNDSSYNQGTVTGDATFNHSSLNYGTVNGDAVPITATINGYELVKVGDPGNAAQSGATGTGSANQNGFGAVATDFWIGKYEVTIGQYTEFLNAVAKTNDRGLFDSTMDTNLLSRGIEQSGTAGAFVYTVVGPSGTNPVGAQSPANRPITRVSWFDAARFANWMANGKPTGPTAPTSTDNGAYNLGATNPGTAPALNTTNPNTGEAPTFSLPTENQWYKAAYYSPVKNGPCAPGYFLYGTGSDSTPGNGWNGTTALADKDLPNQVNYLFGGSRYAVTGSTAVLLADSNQNALTDVGTFTNTYSYYGAFDMSGNVQEWNSDTNVLRGGAWNKNASQTSSAEREIKPLTEQLGVRGFRLASPVPELATLGIVTGDATFNDSSNNQGTVTGDATFNDSSLNQGTVTGDATFNDSSVNSQGGDVGGNATFTLTSAASMISGSHTGTYAGGVSFAYEKGINGSSILGIL